MIHARRIGLVLNPNARGVRERPALKGALKAALGSRGEVVETRTPDDLAGTARRFREEGVDLVATCGGDGTNLFTVSALVHAYGRDRMPGLAILRGGTVNTIAANLQVRGAPEEILRRLLSRAQGGEMPGRGQELLEVRLPGREPLYGFLFAAAMGARFLEAYYAGPMRGPVWAGVLGLRTVASSLVTGRFARRLFQGVPMSLEVDGLKVPEIASPRLFLASTVPDVGLGMRVAWQAGQEPNRFHLIASNLSTVAMATQLHRVLKGRPLSGAPHLDVLAKEARVRFDEPQTFALDGELFRESAVEIGVGPRLFIAHV